MASVETPAVEPSSDARVAETLPSEVLRGEDAGQTLSTGEVLGSYEILEQLGKGGMGRVYLARHRQLGRKVALKLLHPHYASDRDAVKRFFQEAQAVTQIHHPNIIEITDLVHDAAGHCYYIMELLEGQGLDARLSAGALAMSEIYAIAIQICEALQAVHEADIVHRDLKPGNIFLVPNPAGPPTVKLLDFGVVKLQKPREDEQSAIVTNPSAMIGTPEYMAPEQIRATPDVDHRADIYSLGVLLYELVAGVRPLEAPSVGEILVKVVTKDPKPLRSVATERGDEVSKELEALIMGCLEKDPALRPQSAAELLLHLQQFAGLAGEGVDAFVWQGRRRRRRRVAVLGAALLLLAVGGVALYANKKPKPPLRAPVVVTTPKRAGTAIAKLSHLWGDVKHRIRDKKDWTRAKQDMPLYHHDAVRTSNGARSRVAFDVGGWLDVDESSTVLIEAPRVDDGKGGTRVASGWQVTRGIVRVVAQPGVPLRFVTPDGKTTVVTARGDKPTSLRLKARADGSLEVAVLDGQARIRTGSKGLDLDKNELVELAQGKVGERQRLLPFPALVAPAVDASLHEGKALSLQWTPVVGAQSYWVQLSASLVFDQKLVNKLVSTTKLEVQNLPAGKYVWRIASVDKEGHQSEFGFARRFFVGATAGLVPTAPKRRTSAMLTPSSGQVFEVYKTAKTVRFRWRAKRGVRYRLVVAPNAALRGDDVVTREVGATSAQLSVLKPGTFYWGVYALKGGRATALFRRPWRYVVLKRTRPPLDLPGEVDWK